MIEIFGKFYFIDVDEITNSCKTGKKARDADGNDTFEINIFKFELLKLCVERLLNEYEPADDEDIGAFGGGSTSPAFKFAFNTLLKNNIITEDETDE